MIINESNGEIIYELFGREESQTNESFGEIACENESCGTYANLRESISNHVKHPICKYST